MITRWAVTAGIAAVALAAAGCSSSQPPVYDPPPGELIAGTAQVTVNGEDIGTTESVQCSEAGPLTTITTGEGGESSGVSALLASEEELVVKNVSVRDLGGFTGSFNEGLGGDATVTMDGRTYTIDGTAEGFETADPSFRTSGTFKIKVAC
ncbi:lipoprotein LpqH [Mycolicibacterium hippocampi]|uniref:lipoprotein LpqH n=1 Tax=Mycolicibacterium hippocampi TaxID=659824 RepID=UPI0013CFE1C1|nr:lipoprotein LpqH [Mycolicibacterium hippocampi]